MSQGTVDSFLRNGEIGLALLASYNMHRGTAYTLEQCTFSARVGNEGYAEVVIAPEGDKEMATELGNLYLIRPGAKDVTDQEMEFFRGLNINYK
jgi:hypothetical protein